MITPLDVQQSQYPISSFSKLPLGFDFANWLAGGDVITACAATLTDQSTGLTDAGGITAGPQIAGSVVSVTLANLTAGRVYDLVVTATTSAGKTPAARLELKVWF